MTRAVLVEVLGPSTAEKASPVSENVELSTPETFSPTGTEKSDDADESVMLWRTIDCEQ